LPLQAAPAGGVPAALLKASRDITVVKAAAQRAEWDPRPSPRPDRSGDTLAGLGIAYAQRSGAVVARSPRSKSTAARKVWARKFTVAHDCGLIINPDGLKSCIEGISCRAAVGRSRRSRLRPHQGNQRRLALLPDPRHHRGAGSGRHRADQPPRITTAGAGESLIRPVAAAIAKAVFDATGVRLRGAPLTPERLKPVLA